MYDWIKVKEQMPLNPGEVLLTWDGENLVANTFWDQKMEKWRAFDTKEREYDLHKAPTHWFKFPNPPGE